MSLISQLEKNKKATLAVIVSATLLSIATIHSLYERIKLDMDRNYVIMNNYAIRLQRVVQKDMNNITVKSVKQDTILLTKK
jgi:hypothetical protein